MRKRIKWVVLIGIFGGVIAVWYLYSSDSCEDIGDIISLSPETQFTFDYIYSHSVAKHTTLKFVADMSSDDFISQFQYSRFKCRPQRLDNPRIKDPNAYICTYAGLNSTQLVGVIDAGQPAPIEFEVNARWDADHCLKFNDIYLE